VNLTQMIFSYLPYYPVYLAWLVGAILALLCYQRHPRVSQVILAATALFILGMLLQGAEVSWFRRQLRAGTWAAVEVPLAVRVAGVVHALLNAVAYALLLVAVFGWRGNPGAGGGPEGVPPDEAEAED
jgi:hypothetical protein